MRRRLVKRAHIVLEALKGTGNSSIAQRLQIDYETVRRWRDRWHAAESRRPSIEETGKRKLLKQAIEVLLTDEQRPGAPATFTGLSSSCRSWRWLVKSQKHLVGR